MRIIDHISGYRSSVINALIDAVRAQRIVPGPGLRASETPGGTSLTLAPNLSSPWPFGAHYAFGLSISGALVTIYPGAIQAGGQVYTAAQTSITITSHGQYIGLALDRDSGTLTVTGPHNSRPLSSGAVWRTALYVFSYYAGPPVQLAILRECIHDLRLEAAL